MKAKAKAFSAYCSRTQNDTMYKIAYIEKRNVVLVQTHAISNRLH